MKKHHIINSQCPEAAAHRLLASCMAKINPGALQGILKNFSRPLGTQVSQTDPSMQEGS